VGMVPDKLSEFDKLISVNKMSIPISDGTTPLIEL
jgi:hypothetical protein